MGEEERKGERREEVSTSEKREEVQKSELSNTARILTSLAAGGIAGGCAKTVIAPLDRSKIFFQTSEERNYRLRYALRWLRHGYRTEGLLSLWRGNTATLARIVPYSAINFMAFEQYKVLLEVKPETPGYLRFLAGSLAGTTGQLCTYPLDRARAVMAVTPGAKYRNLSSVFLAIYRQEGPLALYRGLTPTLLGVIPYAGTSFYTYETLKRWAVERRAGPGGGGAALPSPLERLGAGAVAGLLGQTASYPLDIVRRRMQTGRQLGRGDKYRSVGGTLYTVYRREGVYRGLYKGLSMNLIKGPLAVSIAYTVNDYARLVLQGACTGG